MLHSKGVECPSLYMCAQNAAYVICYCLSVCPLYSMYSFLQGANIEDPDSNSKTPKMLAVGRRHRELVKLLDKKDSAVDFWDWRLEGNWGGGTFVKTRLFHVLELMSLGHLDDRALLHSSSCAQHCSGLTHTTSRW